MNHNELDAIFRELESDMHVALDPFADRLSLILASAGLSYVVSEEKDYSDGTHANGPSPLPSLSPAQQDALNK